MLLLDMSVHTLSHRLTDNLFQCQSMGFIFYRIKAHYRVLGVGVGVDVGVIVGLALTGAGVFVGRALRLTLSLSLERSFCISMWPGTRICALSAYPTMAKAAAKTQKIKNIKSDRMSIHLLKGCDL